MKPVFKSPLGLLKLPGLAALAAFAIVSGAASASTHSALQRETRIDLPVSFMRADVSRTTASPLMRSPRALGVKTFPTKALPAAPVAKAVSAELPEIYGSVIYADGWTQQDNGVGMYRIGTSDSTPFMRMGDSRVDATNGGVALGDTYWACYSVDIYGYYMVYVLSYDTATWKELTYNVRDTPMISTGVAYDRTTGKVYGCFLSDDGKSYVFGTVDYAAGKRTAIAPLSRMWSAVAATRDGVIYAIDDLGDLYTVDKTSGAMTAVGSTGLVASHPSSACIDYRTGRMFYALTSDPVGALYEIDRATAQPTLVYHFPNNEEVVGMFIPMPDADDAAPDEVSGLTLDFPKGSLSGTVSFNTPSTTFGGETATGNITYVIEANGVTVAQGATSYNTHVDASVTLTKPDNYEFSVYLYNQAGNGPAVNASAFVGNDLPATPDLTASMTDGTITLAWPEVTESVNGGYIDIDALTYTVIRYPDGNVLAEGTKATQLTDTPYSDGTLTGYYYTVTARAGAYTSAEAVSPTFWLGSVTPPYSVKFNSPESFECFPVIDANKDGVTWAWNTNYNMLAVQYNRSNDTDDWLVSPPLKLEKGKMYMFTASMHTYLGNPETMEIRWGKNPTAAGLDRTLMEPTVIRSRASENFSYYLLPEEDGIYYVGIHGISPASDSFYLFADGVTVGAGVEAVIPAEPAEFTVTPDFNGALAAEITFNAPSVAVNGSPLTGITRIDVSRNGKVVKTFTNPDLGSRLSYTDEPDAAGYHKYEALAYNATGAGKKAEATVFVGVNEPAAPAGAKIAETSTPGEVTVSWTQVTTDKDGKPINPALVTYTILGADETGEAVAIAEGITGTSHTFAPVQPDAEQQFVGYGVRAVTDGGYSLMAATSMIPVGTPYETPYNESFANQFAASLIRAENREAVWSIYDDDSGIPTYDRDGGMAAMFGEFDGADATLFSGKISLANVVNPALTFYAYNIAGADPDRNEIEIGISTGDGFVVMRRVSMSQLGEADGWYPVVVALDEFAGKDVQFSLRGVTRSRKFTLVDNITIGSLTDHNLRAGVISAPAAVKPDSEFRVSVVVENMGFNTASGYTVKLFRNGKEVAQTSPAAIGCGETLLVGFDQMLNVTDSDENVYSAMVEYTADNDVSDNTSAEFIVKLELPNHPAPRDLKGVATSEGAVLSWTEPDLAAAIPDAVTETFDDCDSWSLDAPDGWTFLDVDKAGIGQVGGVVLPGIEYNSTLAWFIADDTASGLPAESFAAFSGHKYMSTMFCLPVMGSDELAYVANDDWAVSPLLYGGAQTVSFMARSANPNVAEESFEVLYATDDSTDPADFKSLRKEENVPGLWTRFDIALPDGAKRFAIRYENTFGLMLHVDDVTFIPSGKADLVLEGYNIYRDGRRVNSSLVKEDTWLDQDFDAEAKAVYAVSAHYGAAGESRPGESIVIDQSGIDAVASAAAVNVSARNGVIVVTNATGLTVSVADVAGRIVASRQGSASLEIPVAGGVYVVTAGNLTVKVSVR